MGRGADPSRAADQADRSAYVINHVEGWQTKHLLIVGVGVGIIAFIMGAATMVCAALLCNLRLANAHEAAVLDKVAEIEKPILAMSRSELIGRLAVPRKALDFAGELLQLSASAPEVAPPKWLVRLGLTDRVGDLYIAVSHTREEAVEFVVNFLEGLSADQRAVALGQWAKFIAVAEDPQADNILWQLADLPFDKRDAVLRAGFPPVPDNDPARAVYVALAKAKPVAVEECWVAMHRSMK